MSLASALHRRVLLPAFESGLKRRRTMKHWQELERSQWLAREELQARQFAALKTLLRHAFESCPYYQQEWLRAGLDHSVLRSLEDLSRWPVIRRETVRERRLDMRTSRPMSLITKATGGSSGDPLVFDFDNGSNDRRMAAWHRGYGWAGAAPGSKQLHLWGAAIAAQSLKKRIKDRLYNGLYRRELISCFEMGEGFTESFVRQLELRRPDVIVAYTNPLYEVATQLEQSGASPSFRPQAIVLGAEKLHDFQRERIQRVFGAPVFETYGSREFMLIGAECERHTGLHITAEHLIVEILDDDGQPMPTGAEGNVVITDLFNYGMPFIRYANGDRAIASASTCPCGRGLPLLSQVSGRVLDMIRTPDGRVLPGEFFPHLMKDFPSVRRFQVIQEEPSRLRVLLNDGGLTALDRARLETAVRCAAGPSVQVSFESVVDIPLTRSGKLQVVINRAVQRRAA